MKNRRWSVIRCTGPEGELIWSVVHREKPMFVAVVSDSSVDHLEEVPAGAVHWAKQASATGDIRLMREAIETLRSWRNGMREPSGQGTLQRTSFSGKGLGRKQRGRFAKSDEDNSE